jgi:hypothetical protein
MRYIRYKIAMHRNPAGIGPPYSRVGFVPCVIGKAEFSKFSKNK